VTKPCNRMENQGIGLQEDDSAAKGAFANVLIRVPMGRGSVCFDPRGRMWRYVTSHTRRMLSGRTVKPCRLESDMSIPANM
jgi:hypothetical protein